jgi:hypothetical protein
MTVVTNIAVESTKASVGVPGHAIHTEDKEIRDKAAKASLRQLMVSCIDSALEELGTIGDVSEEQLKRPLPVATNTSPCSSTADADPYGYGPASPEPSKVCPDLGLHDNIRRHRYQRRNSVTKFSLSCALKQVQQDDEEGNHVSPHSPQGTAMMMMKRRITAGGTMTPSRQLWQHLYSKLDERPLKRSALTLSTGLPCLASPSVIVPLKMPDAKRCRDSAA